MLYCTRPASAYVALVVSMSFWVVNTNLWNTLFHILLWFHFLWFCTWGEVLLLLIRYQMLYNPNLWMLWRRTSIQLSYFVGKFLISFSWIVQEVRYITILYHYWHAVNIITYHFNLSDLKAHVLLNMQSINLFLMTMVVKLTCMLPTTQVAGNSTHQG